MQRNTKKIVWFIGGVILVVAIITGNSQLNTGRIARRSSKPAPPPPVIGSLTDTPSEKASESTPSPAPSPAPPPPTPPPPRIVSCTGTSYSSYDMTRRGAIDLTFDNGTTRHLTDQCAGLQIQKMVCLSPTNGIILLRSCEQDVGPGSTCQQGVCSYLTNATVDPLQFTPSAGQSTTLRFTLSAVSNVTASIENSSGAAVRTLTAENLASGSQSITWDGKDGSNQNVPGGTYTARITAQSGQYAPNTASVQVIVLQPPCTLANVTITTAGGWNRTTKDMVQYQLTANNCGSGLIINSFELSGSATPILDTHPSYRVYHGIDVDDPWGFVESSGQIERFAPALVSGNGCFPTPSSLFHVLNSSPSNFVYTFTSENQNSTNNELRPGLTKILKVKGGPLGGLRARDRTEDVDQLGNLLPLPISFSLTKINGISLATPVTLSSTYRSFPVTNSATIIERDDRSVCPGAPTATSGGGQASGGAIGAACTDHSECGSGLCVRPALGQPKVCTRRNDVNDGEYCESDAQCYTQHCHRDRTDSAGNAYGTCGLPRR